MPDFFCCSICIFEDACCYDKERFCKHKKNYLENPEKWEKGYYDYLKEQE